MVVRLEVSTVNIIEYLEVLKLSKNSKMMAQAATRVSESCFHSSSLQSTLDRRSRLRYTIHVFAAA